jgi:uncharacterized membrane protein YkvA (DUF1232 family)
MEQKLNTYFEKALRDARELINNKDKLSSTLDKAFKKVVDIEDKESGIGKLVSRVKLFIRMVKAYIEGEYRDVPWKTIAIIIASLIYFINPFDLVPDFLPGIGYLDDITVILWVFKSVEDEVLKYQDYLYTSDSGI